MRHFLFSDSAQGEMVGVLAQVLLPIVVGALVLWALWNAFARVCGLSFMKRARLSIAATVAAFSLTGMSGPFITGNFFLKYPDHASPSEVITRSLFAVAYVTFPLSAILLALLAAHWWMSIRGRFIPDIVIYLVVSISMVVNYMWLISPARS